MQNLTGKTAVITGGASGIGFALAKAFAADGMKVMLADIEPGPLDAAVAQLGASGADVRGVVCDVADAASVAAAAQATVEAFGKVHILCNNAGVASGGGIDLIDLASWRWVIDVNLMGVVHGIAAFLPLMRAHGEPAHILNTASMAGMQSNMGFSPYTASKFAVVAMSEGLAVQLADSPIGVSVLCPAFVRTRIHESARNRTDAYGPAPVIDPDTPAGKFGAAVAALVESGRDADEIAAMTLAKINADELYIFTHPEWTGEVETRFERILTAMGVAPN